MPSWGNLCKQAGGHSSGHWSVHLTFPRLCYGGLEAHLTLLRYAEAPVSLFDMPVFAWIRLCLHVSFPVSISIYMFLYNVYIGTA